MEIRQATSSDADLLARLVSESNKDVALKFGLNAENCPKHPSFCTVEWLQADFSRGEIYFIAYRNSEPVACVATEYPSVEVAYLNRLSVLPAHRRCGIGAELVSFVVELAHSRGAKSVSIGVIGEYTALQAWYQKLGFVSGETKRFAHLPFSVKYMAHALTAI